MIDAPPTLQMPEDAHEVLHMSAKQEREERKEEINNN